MGVTHSPEVIGFCKGGNVIALHQACPRTGPMHKRLGAEILRPGRKTRDKPEMAKQLQGFNEHMQRLMDNYHYCKLRAHGVSHR